MLLIDEPLSLAMLAKLALLGQISLIKGPKNSQCFKVGISNPATSLTDTRERLDEGQPQSLQQLSVLIAICSSNTGFVFLIRPRRETG